MQAKELEMQENTYLWVLHRALARSYSASSLSVALQGFKQL